MQPLKKWQRWPLQVMIDLFALQTTAAAANNGVHRVNDAFHFYFLTRSHTSQWLAREDSPAAPTAVLIALFRFSFIFHCNGRTACRRPGKLLETN